MNIVWDVFKKAFCSLEMGMIMKFILESALIHIKCDRIWQFI